jgi:DNA-binding CsgD family transcriptional regulator
LDAPQQAIDRDHAARAQRAQAVELHDRYESLSSREQEVLEPAVRGLLNKQIVGDLGTSEATVKLHRSHVMHKMQADSLAELIRMAEKLGVPGNKVTSCNLATGCTPPIPKASWYPPKHTTNSLPAGIVLIMFYESGRNSWSRFDRVSKHT